METANNLLFTASATGEFFEFRMGLNYSIDINNLIALDMVSMGTTCLDGKTMHYRRPWMPYQVERAQTPIVAFLRYSLLKIQ